ncbi:MAG: nicotinate-nucleotide--dimethylbenzimidazole phosphoribosyltransferase [Gemmataceae bacterium]
MNQPLLEATCAGIGPLDERARAATLSLLDAKTKPRGSLGRLEELAGRLAAIFGQTPPARLEKAIVVMAADHGITAEGVSAYPAEVTVQMVRNFMAGGAAINVLARLASARVVIADMGTFRDGEHPEVRRLRIGAGTASFVNEPAMSRAQAKQSLEAGIGLAHELIDKDGVKLLGIGDMGIGNTTAASALSAVFCHVPVEPVTGRGTGIDPAAFLHKLKVIGKALALHRPDPDDALDVLAKVGGFEIGGLAGVLLGAASRRVPVLLDGFITGSAALVAHGLCPAVRDYLLASHASVEPGHRIVLEHLGLRALLDLELRLGEGTGAALAMHLVEAALRILHEMATFESARVLGSLESRL